MVNLRIGTWRLLSGVALLAMPSLSWAQGSEPASAAHDDGLGEIVVTAQKRAQSVDSVGMTINAATGDQLKALGIDAVEDLVKIEPSFVVAQSSQGQPIYSIRGVGFNTTTVGAPAAVSVYVDEVPYPYVAMSKGAMLDLERVEILKGPQGTLFGQNATGGAINYIAAKPTDTFQFGVDVSYARFNAVDLEGYVSGPITGNVNARLAVKTEQGGAWQRSVTRDDKLGDKNNKYARLLLDWAVTDKLKLSLNLNGWTNNSENQAPAISAIALANPARASLVPLTANAPIAPHDPRAADWVAGTHPQNDEDYYQASLRADYDLSDTVQLTYLGTYQHYKQSDTLAYTGTPTPADARLDATVKSTSHELRLSGKAFDGKLLWLAGGYYAKDKDNEFLFARTIGFTTAYALVGIPGITTAIDAIGATTTQDVETKAIFGNLEFHILDTLAIHAGGRYTDTNNDHTGCSVAPNQNVANIFTALQSFTKRGVGVIPVQVGGCLSFDATNTPALVVDSLDENNTSWRFGLDWTPAARTLVYGTISRGYKAGSFLNSTVVVNSTLQPVVQESVTAYEAGFKTRLAGNTLQLAGALFYYDFKNKQQALYRPVPVFGNLPALLNIPKSRVKGAELSARYRPFEGLMLDGAFTYLDTEVVGDFRNNTQFGQINVNFRGEPLPATPKWAFTVGARFDWSIGADYRAFVGGDVRYSSRTQSYFGTAMAIAAGFPSMFNEEYAILNLRAGVDSNDGKWKFQIFGDNVTNSYYTKQSIRVDTVARYVGMPATYGIRVGYRY